VAITARPGVLGGARLGLGDQGGQRVEQPDHPFGHRADFQQPLAGVEVPFEQGGDLEGELSRRDRKRALILLILERV